MSGLEAGQSWMEQKDQVQENKLEEKSRIIIVWEAWIAEHLFYWEICRNTEVSEI